MTQCLGLQLQDSHAATSWVTRTSLASSSPSGIFCAKKVHEANGYIHGRKTFRTLTCNDVCLAPKFRPPNCWKVHNFEETSLGFPCLPFTPTAGPCQKKGMDWVGFWFDLTYGRWELCFHTSLFLGNACFRAPLATVELSLHMPSYSPQPCTYCSIYTVTIVPHHAAPSEQELPGVLAQHNILSSQAKPRSLSLPTLHHLFLVQ